MVVKLRVDRMSRLYSPAPEMAITLSAPLLYPFPTSGASSNSVSKGSTSFLGGSGSPGSGSLDFPSAIRDNPAKGLNTDSETG